MAKVSLHSRASAPSQKRSPRKHPSPTTGKKTISASLLFMAKSPKPMQRSTAPKPPLIAKPSPSHGMAIKKPLARRTMSQSSTRSPLKASPGEDLKSRLSRKPIDEEFKQTTATYRRHLLETATAQIDAQYEALVEALHATNVQAVTPSTTAHPKDSPLRLSVAGRIQREIGDMYMPMGEAILHFNKVQKDGTKKTHSMEFKLRISQFDAYIKQEEKKLMELQRQWETIVGEIYKCGTEILGIEAMDQFLGEGSGDKDKEFDEENTLFVPEEGDEEVPAVVSEAVKPRKKVSFKDPLPQPPRFLTQKSILPELASTPELPARDIEKMEDKVESLGAAQIDDFQKLYRDQDKWYKMKSKKICDAVMQDD